jgi:hypothetical protein
MHSNLMYWCPQQHDDTVETLATHMGLEKVTPDDMNSFDRRRLEEETREKIAAIQEELVRRMHVSLYHVMCTFIHACIRTCVYMHDVVFT